MTPQRSWALQHLHLKFSPLGGMPMGIGGDPRLIGPLSL
jgi:hypothetical protein